MTIRLLLDAASRTIEDVAVRMDAVPFAACRETVASLAAVKGLTITRGFTAKVKNLVGHGGCTHLVELLQALAPNVILGLHARGSRRAPEVNPEWTKKRMGHLVNSCHAWKEDGELVAGIKMRFGAQ
jgi:radical SAM superfamily enzyme